MITCILLISCEKDPVISTAAVTPSTLQEFLVTTDTSQLSDSIYAYIGNHPSFEKETPEQSVHLFFDMPEDARDLQLFVTDSLKFRDSLGAYHLRSYHELKRVDERFVRLAPKLKPRNYFIRIYYRIGETSYLSRPIANRYRSFQSRSMPATDITITERSNRFTTFQWQSIPGTDHYLLELASPTGEVFMALGVHRTEFQFYDLRNITFNLTPELYDPELVSGNAYTLSVKAVSNVGFLLSMGEKAFEAP